MATSPLQSLTEPVVQAWRRPLSLRESVTVALVLFLFGTAYCQLYCALAMPAMKGMGMPLDTSMWRSAVETIPAFIGFELGKRVLYRSKGSAAVLGVAAVLLLAAALSIALMLLCHEFFYETAMPVRLLIADRLPGITLIAVAIAWAGHQARDAGRSRQPAEDESITMPPLQLIDWVQAAGNYVEIHTAGRTIMLRMTLRQAIAALRPGPFVQIHRSVIVNRDRIASWDRPHRPRRVRLADGAELAVGESYRASIDP